MLLNAKENLILLNQLSQISHLPCRMTLADVVTLAKCTPNEQRPIQWRTSPSDVRLRKAVRHEAGKEADKLQAKSIKKVADNYHLLWLLALRDEYGFGQARLVRTLNRVVKDADAISEGRLNFEDIRTMLKDEVRLDV